MIAWLYATRDAFFYWAGVWATVTFVNDRIRRYLRRREHAEYQRGFMENVKNLSEPEAEETPVEFDPKEGGADGD